MCGELPCAVSCQREHAYKQAHTYTLIQAMLVNVCCVCACMYMQSMLAITLINEEDTIVTVMTKIMTKMSEPASQPPSILLGERPLGPDGKPHPGPQQMQQVIAKKRMAQQQAQVNEVAGVMTKNIEKRSINEKHI